MRSALLLVVLTLALPAQIIGGTFEFATPGSSPPSPWSAPGGTVTVLPSGTCTSEPLIPFPTEGLRWAQIEASLTGSSTLSDYRTTAEVLEQTFTYGTGSSVLNLDVCFVNFEPPISFGSNDFMVVEVETGGSFTTLLTVDSSTGSFTNFAVCGSKPATDVITLALDLATAFPGTNGSTPFTLSIYVANGAGALTNSFRSRAYVDNVRLGDCSPAASIDAQFCQDSASGLWRLEVWAANFPNAEAFNFLSLTPSSPLGSGPFFGLAFTPDVINQAFMPLGSQPFHVPLDGNGRYTFGPLAIPAGLNISLDYTSVVVSAGTIGGNSFPRRVTFN